MSDKKRRDITLGEMQDECSFRGGNCQTISCATVGGDMCVHYKICGKIGKPIDWDLTDPPRFTEAQMAFWRELFNIGVKYVYNGVQGLYLSDCADGDGNMGVIKKSEAIYWLKAADRLDLAELLGKDGAE